MQDLRTVHFRCKREDEKAILLSAIKSSAHFQNILILLINENYKCHKAGKEQNFRNSLLNKRIMRAVIASSAGGKNQEKVKELLKAFSGNKLFLDLLDVGNQLKEKNVAQLVGKIKSAYKAYFTKRKKGEDANPPKTRRLERLCSFSIPIDQCAFSLKKKGKLRINLNKEMQDFQLSHDQLLQIIPSISAIQSLEIVYKHDEIYFSITYHPEVDMDRRGPRTVKSAGLDLGLRNTAAIFIDDTSSESLVISGQKLIAFNQKNNAAIDRAKSAEQRSRNAVDNKKQKVKAELATDFVSVEDFLNFDWEAFTLKQSHGYAKERLAKIYRKRHRYYKDTFHKLAKRILEYLAVAEVTQLFVSKNLGHAKQEKGKGKAFNKKFHPVPMVKLIDYLLLKGAEFGIAVQEIDEAYTSKSSCISGDANKAQVLSRQGFHPIPVDVFKGRRVGRSQYSDSELKKTFSADLNAAVNHIIVGRKSSAFGWLKRYLWKLTRPKVFTCDSLFLDCSLNRDFTQLKDPLRRVCAAKFLSSQHLQVFAG